MKTRNKSINNLVFILVWVYEPPHIERIERIFDSATKVSRYASRILEKIKISMTKRSRIVRDRMTIAEENKALKKWDHMLASGEIDQKTYDYSMLDTSCLCIRQWHTKKKAFQCVCSRFGISSHRY